MNINEITMGMTPQEKNVYFKHMEKRHREDQERIQAERESNKTYREILIADILESDRNEDLETLKKYSIRTLEMMASY